MERMTIEEFNLNLFESLEVIKNSDSLRNRWKIYREKYEYAENINFDEILIA